MMEQFSRTERLIGSDHMERLRKAHVAVFGLGGVGGYAAEALARSGVGALDVIDPDRVCLTNLNRQIFATRGTIGRRKADAAKERILDINPDAQVRAFYTFYMPETAGQFDFSQYDYVVDAVDTVTAKIALVMQAQESGTPLISSMGTGNKLDPTAFRVADIYETSVCPLARVMRRELRKRGIRHLKVIYSQEQPVCPLLPSESGEGPDDSGPDAVSRRVPPGSMSFVPPAAGLILAGEVVKDLTVRSGR